MKLIANKHIDAVLCLSDGSYVFGRGVGSFGQSIGEICFNTSITGYQEVITDPSYAGQIVAFTFPHIGNVGCNNEDMESNKTYCKGVILRSSITEQSNFRSEAGFEVWLKSQNLIGISGVDTRSLTRKIRNNGACNVIISYVEQGEEMDTEKLISQITDLPTLNGMELATKVTTKAPYELKDKRISKFLQNQQNSQASNGYKIVVVDFGIKNNILNDLLDYGFEIQVVPAQSTYAQISQYKPDGVFLSNGPGDPFAVAQYAVPMIKEVLKNNLPIFGICMGHQLLSTASGLATEKMHQGHRGANHPVKNLFTNVVEITSQNHGFCVSKKDIPANVKISHISLFDDTIQGIELTDKAAFSVQYHPESSPGPHDSKYLFARFKQLIDESKCQN
jgi:carbamoyl-phosphate synthase small subunit